MLTRNIAQHASNVIPAIAVYCCSNPNPLSIRMPLPKGPRPVAKTISDIATALTDPRCFVPKNSGQNAPETVAPKPCIKPRNAKQIPAPDNVLA